MPRPLPAPHLPLLTRALLLLLGLAPLAACVETRGKISPEVKLEIHRETALTYYETGDLDRAEDQALRGLAVDERDKTLQLILGWVNLQRGNGESLWKAEYVFEGMQDQDDFRVDLGLGETRERLGILHDQTADAIEAGEQLPTSRGENAVARDVERLRDKAHELWNQAIDAYGEVLDAEPEHVKALNGLQRSWSLLGDLERSMTFNARLIESLNFKLDETSQMLEDPFETLDVSAQARLRELVRDNRELLVNTHLFAQALELRLDHPRAALEHLDRVIELDDSQLDAYARRGQLRHQLGDPVGAVADLSRFIARSNLPFEDPDIRRAWDLRAQAQLQVDALSSR